MGLEVLTKCFSEPKYFLRLLAVMLCLCISGFQLSASIMKIMNPPLSTHYAMRLNESMYYPSVTICKNPGYKSSKFEKYGLSLGPPYSSIVWKDFKFNTYTLDEFFEEATYSLEEIIEKYGFLGYSSNIRIEKMYKLRYGACYKLTGTIPANVWNADSGYQIYMQNDEAAMREPVLGQPPELATLSLPKIKSVNQKSSPGYFVFIHQTIENITDQEFQSYSFMESMYLDVGEDLNYNMKTNQYRQKSRDKCKSDYFYSKAMCKEECLKKKVTEKVGCSTPWLENVSLPRCNNYNDLNNIIMLYQNDSIRTNDSICFCPKSCNMRMYSPYMQNFYDMDNATSSFLAIYYSANIVTVMEEVSGYDWNQFLSDLGGSLGFFLGLSVLGIISVVEEFIDLMYHCKKSRKKVQRTKETTCSEDLNDNVDIYMNGRKVHAGSFDDSGIVEVYDGPQDEKY